MPVTQKIPQCCFSQITFTYDHNFINQFIFEILTCSVITISLIIRSFNMLANSIKHVHLSFAVRKSLKNCISLELFPMEMLLFSSLIIDYIDLGILYVIYTNDIQMFSQNHCHLIRCIFQLIIIILDSMSRISLLLSLWQMLPSWVIFIRLILANDVELNPGDFSNSFFYILQLECQFFSQGKLPTCASFRSSQHFIHYIYIHIYIYNYDLISLCEVSLNNTVEIPVPLLGNYTFVSKNNLGDTRHGGVGLFYKKSLPLLVRNDQGFDESLVMELQFGRNFFFTVIYRSPSHSYGSPEFETFLQNFQDLYNKIKSENPHSMFFTGVFNDHSQLWWSG